MLSILDKRIIRRLQEELPLEERPFKTMAEELGTTEDELLQRIRGLQEEKIMRRFGAVLHHRKAGFSHNAMVVWSVSAERIEEAGAYMASFPQVSHCYRRTASSLWEYTLYTMIHGRTREDCESVISDISRKTGITAYEILYSIKELKKESMKYFTGQED